MQNISMAYQLNILLNLLIKKASKLFPLFFNHIQF